MKRPRQKAKGGGPGDVEKSDQSNSVSNARKEGQVVDARRVRNFRKKGKLQNWRGTVKKSSANRRKKLTVKKGERQSYSEDEGGGKKMWGAEGRIKEVNDSKNSGRCALVKGKRVGKMWEVTEPEKETRPLTGTIAGEQGSSSE